MDQKDVWREVASLVSRPCRRRRPSSLDDGGISGLFSSGGPFLPHFRDVFNYYLLEYFLMAFLFVFFFWDSYDLNVGAFHIVPDVSEVVLNSFISYPLFFFIFPLLMLMRIVWGTLLGWISHGIYVLISLLVWGLPFFFASIIIFCNKCLFHFLYFPLSPGDLIYKRYFSSCTLI